MTTQLSLLIERCQTTSYTDSKALREIDYEIVRVMGWSDRYDLPETNSSPYPKCKFVSDGKFSVPEFSTSLDALKHLKSYLGECTHWGVLTKKEGGYSAFVTIWCKDSLSSTLLTASHETSDTLALCIAILTGLLKRRTEQ